ncbi:acyl-CoA dehydrogenase [Pseudomonas sp. PB120]|uniref:acyl-CoA dehydrogenase n=1 Tax=Pseudomonas sp. PB120 TaxID=2494700 RepID=UPI0012FE6777|nr:acyl-CoA dehydrogenase [Pseudomonas sp. PB120]MVV48081.1 acyl-CoA dehydrogenase [Pseudomonas sp. PB120]
MSSAAIFEKLLNDFAARPVLTAPDNTLQRVMLELIQGGFTTLPLPGQGHTLDRWRALSAVAASDLALVKLFEGHTDALAIMKELEPGEPIADGTWATWAAEPHFARVKIIDRQADLVYMQGRKAWCSGAPMLDQALMTAWDEHSRPQLVCVDLHQANIRRVEDAWQAVGMGSTASVDVEFEGAVGRCIGSPGQYLDRPGFWQGGGGIAACWYGAACALASYLREHCKQAHHDAHSAAHLGAVDAALCAASASLRETALWIDANPRRSAEIPVRRLRAQVELAVNGVLEHVGRALGATPFCRNGHFARLAADLPVFLRQSHAEKELAALGELIAAQPVSGWSL